MKFKKVMAAVMASAMVFSLTACGGSTASETTNGTKEEVGTAEAGTEGSTAEAPAENAGGVHFLLQSGIPIRNRVSMKSLQILQQKLELRQSLQ